MHHPDLLFLNNRLPFGVIARCPFPDFVQAYLAISQQLRCGPTHTRHQFALIIHLVIAHINIARSIHQTDQMTLQNLAA